MQTLQGAALVGHDVTLQGNRLAVVQGSGVGGFELANTADRVKVEILAPSGHVVDTLELGALGDGRHGFNWPAGNLPDGAPYRFRVVATAGAAAVSTTPLMRDRVEAVHTVGDRLMLETQLSGSIGYADVKAFN
jgi:flagellar basal-body rod modification protein FlgD